MLLIVRANHHCEHKRLSTDDHRDHRDDLVNISDHRDDLLNSLDHHRDDEDPDDHHVHP